MLLGSDDNHLIFDSLTDPGTIAGYLSNPIGDLSIVLLLPETHSSKNFSFANFYINFLTDKLARSAL